MVRKILLNFIAILTVLCSFQDIETNNKGVTLNSIVPYDNNISYSFTNLVDLEKETELRTNFELNEK